MSLSKSLLKKIGFALLCLFALIGFATTGVFVAIQLHLTNTSGIVDTTNRYLGVTERNAWQNTEEWPTLEKAVISDKKAIDAAALATDVPTRLIAAQLVVEQLRLYNSERELFKLVFKPLNILGVQSQYSWGVMGIKEDTAIQIEQHLTDTTSPYFPGEKYQHLLDFKTDDHNKERFERLTDEHNHSYSYIYTGVFLKEIMTGWKKAGFDISKRPEILSTLFNIGFNHSNPNKDPKVGGAEITVGDETYSFGELAYAFYMSDKLLTEFPR